jgi:hypothetical protein
VEVAAAQASVEAVHEREGLLLDIAELSRGSIRGYASFRKEIAANIARAKSGSTLTNTSGGWTEWGDATDRARQFQRGPSTLFTIGPEDRSQSTIEFRPRTEDIIESRTTMIPRESKRRIFGSKVEMVEEARQVKTGTRPVSHKEVVGAHGSDEPSVIVSMSLAVLGRVDEFNRPAKFNLAFDVPEGVATRLQEAIAEDETSSWY